MRPANHAPWVGRPGEELEEEKKGEEEEGEKEYDYEVAKEERRGRSSSSGRSGAGHPSAQLWRRGARSRCGSRARQIDVAFVLAPWTPELKRISTLINFADQAVPFLRYSPGRAPPPSRGSRSGSEVLDVVHPVCASSPRLDSPRNSGRTAPQE